MDKGMKVVKLAVCLILDDDDGQVSDRPTIGRFTQISSGDTHTCALRDDGTVMLPEQITAPSSDANRRTGG